jgi:Tol biopolymer transport system component
VQPFDAERFMLGGEPAPIADQITLSSEVANLAAFSVSQNGTLVYRAGDSGQTRQMVWFDRTGKAIQGFDRESASTVNPALSPDGTRVVFNRLSGAFDVWILDAVRGNVTRLTSQPFIDVQPIWTPDGKRVLFSSGKGKGGYSLYEQAASGTESDRLILENAEGDFLSPRDVSRDGRFLLYLRTNPNTGWDIWAMPLTGSEKKPFPVVATTFEDRDPVFSPDGRWIAYQSDETGRFEIYAQPFRGPAGKVAISSGGGTQPRWSGNGKEIFYIGPDSKLMAAPVSPEGDTLRPGVPSALFQTRIAGGPLTPAPNRQQYDVSRDGQRFIINTSTEEASTAAITVILNWKPPGR